jgi:hypothetical protein
MEPLEQPPQTRGLTAIDGAMALIIVLLVVQMWLLTATLEAYLAGEYGAALPGVFASALMFAACVGLYIFVDAVDASVRKRL